MKIKSNRTFDCYETAYESWSGGKDITLDGIRLVSVTILDEIRAEIEKAIWEDVIISLSPDGGVDKIRVPRLDPDEVLDIIDKYKECEHCKFFIKDEDANAIYNHNECTNANSPKYGIGKVHYWNRCKQFEWAESDDK